MNAPLIQIGGGRRPVGGLLPEDEADRWRRLTPRFAHLYVENKCHLACEHCYESEDSHPHHEHLSTEEWMRIIDQLADLGALVVTFSGGEVFLRRDLLELVAHARQRRFHVRIYTSGTHIDEAKADRIAELGVAEVHVSVYSHDPAVHDAFTKRPGSHEKSVRALRLLHDRGVRTFLKASVLDVNVDGLSALLSLAESVGAGAIIGPELYPRLNGDRAPRAHAVSAEALGRAYFEQPEISSFLSGATPAVDACQGDGSWSTGKALCTAARGLVAIGSDGGVYACAMFPVPGGSLKTNSLEDVWRRSALFDRVRRTTFGEMTHCSSCDVRSSCTPCMAYAAVEHGDVRECNSTSKHVATARRFALERRAAAERRMARGKALRVVDGEHAPRPERPSRAVRTLMLG